MNFKKGDKVRTEDGHAGQILYIDNGGLEAQVALERITVKVRTDSLELFDAPPPTKRSAKPAARKRAVHSPPKK